MGIPSYFSHIIRNYGQIIRRLQQCNRFQHLFMDCNSFVYGSWAGIEKRIREGRLSMEEIEKRGGIEELIIYYTIQDIREQIGFIKPEKSIYIAFDGKPPYGKMLQQRQRRYRSCFNRLHSGGQEPIWDTVAITHGTPFMALLSSAIYTAFENTEKQFHVEKVIVSCSDQPGEGEHKLFKHMRENDFTNDDIAVYGLDSDLIMLSIFHQHCCKCIHVYREAPEFRSVISEFQPNERLFLNIPELCVSINQYMCCVETQINRVYDYVFMCFMLGNDFMPGFPSLSIRTHGLQVLMDTYRENIGNTTDLFLDLKTKEIQWKVFKRFISALATQEEELLKKEITNRRKYDKWNAKTREEIILNAPKFLRQREEYINPWEDGWKARYDMLYGNDAGLYLRKLKEVLKYYGGEGCEVVEEEMIMGCRLELIKNRIRENGEKSEKRVLQQKAKEIDVIPVLEKAKGLKYEMDFKNYDWESMATNLE